MSVLGFAQTSRSASGRARLAARVRGSAAGIQYRPCRRNPPPIPVQAAVGDGGDRRGATCVPQTRIFAELKRRATTGRPLFIYCKDKIKAYPILSASLAHCRIFSQNVCMKKTAFHTEKPFRYRGRILYRTYQNVRRSRIYAATSLMGRRTCSMVSRSRMVTQPSCSESKS